MSANTNNNNGNTNIVSSRISNATRYIITILVKYQKLNDTQLQQKEKQEILNELLNINAVELIDNFNITIDESNSYDFETIYQMILNQMNPNQTSSYSSSSCNVTLCKMIQRNNRDRITKYGISNIYYNIKDDSKIVIVQLLDKIHCYFMHSFDFGLKFTKNEWNCIYNKNATNNNSEDTDIDPMLLQIKEIIKNKQTKIPKASLRYDHRYITKITDGISSEESNEENKNDNNNSKDNILISATHSSFNLFTFGKRWRYSKKYQHNTGIDKMNVGKYNQWFVSQKYTNLKREMLSNSIKKIPMQQWHQINSKSENYLKCNKIKLLRAYKNVNYEFDDSIPNIIENQSITIGHIICILIYSNFTSIKNSLIDTYNTMNKFEEWKDVKQRHCEFANFGRILTETVEVFGEKQSKNSLYYHTLLGTFQLHSIQCRFFVPTSMTTELSVITYYYYNTLNIERYTNGFIIGFNNNLSSYFNCSFLSDFTNENECIFLGGKQTLHFNLIYNMPLLHNYKYYISAIKLIDELFIHNNRNNNRREKPDLSNVLVYAAYKKCILNQIEEAHCIPSAIDSYLNGWCISRKHMNISIGSMNINKYYLQLLYECSLLIQYPPPDNIYTISIDSLCRLFPNIITIKIQSPILDIKCLLLHQIHQFLCREIFYGLDLLEIELIQPITHTNSSATSMNDIISQYSVAFFNIGWSIKIESSNNIINNLRIIKLKGIEHNKGHITKGIEHKKSKSTPTLKDDVDPFNLKTQLLNQSAGVLMDNSQQENSINMNELYENDSNLTDISQITQNTNYTKQSSNVQHPMNNNKIQSQSQFTKVHIKMRIKKKNKSKGDLEIEFDFNNGEQPEIVANEMIKELDLPLSYKQEIINVIIAAIPSHNLNTRANRTQSHSKVPSQTNVSLVECTYPSAPLLNVQDNIINDYISDDINNNPSITVEDTTTTITAPTGPTEKQKRALQQQQTQIKQRVRITDPPGTNITQQQSLPLINNNNNKKGQLMNKLKSNPQLYNDGRRRKQTVSIFDQQLILLSFNKYEFPLSAVDLLEGKNAEFHAEYKSFLQTQSQIYDLKLEHIKIQNNNNILTNKFEESHQSLAKSMQEKIEAKRKELTGKWDEFVKDQKEINDLKQQISKKHLSQFKKQIHFEQQKEFIQIMNSNKINQNEKEIFKQKLKEFRDNIVNDYQTFREKLYQKYENKLKQIDNI